MGETLRYKTSDIKVATRLLIEPAATLVSASALRTAEHSVWVTFIVGWSGGEEELRQCVRDFWAHKSTVDPLLWEETRKVVMLKLKDARNMCLAIQAPPIEV